MTPSVGRIVHYGWKGTSNSPVVAWAAIITWVNPDGTVNLVRFTQGGHAAPAQNVRFSEELADLCWSWPPKE